MKSEKLQFKIENFYFLVVIFSFALLVLGFSDVEAADLYLSPAAGSYNVGQQFSVSVYVSSADQAMNAASGVISFPRDKLEVVSLSKSGSIFNLWVQEPVFFNSVGTVNFEGIVLNPGFIGLGGKIITINFKTKTVGTAILSFSSGSVLANDGKGTNILTNLGSANFALAGVVPPPAVEETIISGAPKAPKISSPTHPDSEEWYSNNDPEFTWKLPSDVTGVSFSLHKSPTASPGNVSDGLMESKKYENIEDSIWYFHIKFKNKHGWGQITHYRIKIDTTPPQPFEIVVKEGKETTNPQPTLSFETTDEMSGIDHYEIRIGQTLLIETKEKEYKIPVQKPGKHTIIIKTIDKAGNYTLAMTEIDILSIATPAITNYPSTLSLGAILTMKGTALPDAKVKVYIQKGDWEVKTEEIKSDKEGNWFYIGTDFLEKGIYNVWVKTIDVLGVRSEPSGKISIKVSPPALIKIGKLSIDYLTVIVVLLVLIFILALGIIWSWQKNKPNKKRKKKIKKLRKEITEAEKSLHYAFKTLREETEKQIAKLDGKPDLSAREKQICDDFKKALEISEKFIGKEIKNIEKELK